MRLLAAVAIAALTAWPATAAPPKSKPPIVAAQVRVWVNDLTGVYHRPGCKWYGHTSHGHWATKPQGRPCKLCSN